MIKDIYMVKYQPSTKTKFYQRARYFRRVGDNQTAFCLEPFNTFKNGDYVETINPRNLSSQQIERIKKLVAYGYSYGNNHWGGKWYAITQLMIWQTADPSGDYYFTDTLNGNRINPYQDEINEVNSLIEKSYILPSINNKDYYFIEGDKVVINDTNNVLSNFKTDDKNVSINENTLTINNLQKGDYKYTLHNETRKHNLPIIFYQAENSQNLVTMGDIEETNISFRVHILNTRIDITKIDSDTNSIIPSGSAILDGAKYKLTDENGKEIKILEIKNNIAEIENIPFGKYYLKEIEAGKGYNLDEKTYEITISKENPTIELVLKNNVIKKKIKIEKLYGDNILFQSEKNIDFEIYDEKNNLIKTISTNDEGICEIELPYGKYTIKQKNTTEGYSKIEPFTIIVDNSVNDVITLKDYKIPVPDTHTSIFNNIYKFILKTLLLIIC